MSAMRVSPIDSRRGPVPASDDWRFVGKVGVTACFRARRIGAACRSRKTKWCPGQDSNLHGLGPDDFKSSAFTISPPGPIKIARAQFRRFGAELLRRIQGLRGSNDRMNAPEACIAQKLRVARDVASNELRLVDGYRRRREYVANPAMPSPNINAVFGSGMGAGM